MPSLWQDSGVLRDVKRGREGQAELSIGVSGPGAGRWAPVRRLRAAFLHAVAAQIARSRGTGDAGPRLLVGRLSHTDRVTATPTSRARRGPSNRRLLSAGSDSGAGSATIRDVVPPILVRQMRSVSRKRHTGATSSKSKPPGGSWRALGDRSGSSISVERQPSRRCPDRGGRGGGVRPSARDLAIMTSSHSARISTFRASRASSAGRT